MPTFAGIAIEFWLFTATLAGVALFHRHTFGIAVAGVIAVALYKVAFSPFHTGAGATGLLAHLDAESVLVSNLLLLLLGFALLADHFERSHVPALMPRFLPDDWKGPLVLLWLVFVLSSFLDNIAGALVGGTIASSVFRGKVHIGYLAAIVAAANAGGAGSVIGDTTTTMMWIAGVSPFEVLEAFIAAGVATLIFGTIAARQQHRFQRITKSADPTVHVDWPRAAIVMLILSAAVAANVVVNLRYHSIADSFPFLGATLWAALLVMTPVRRPTWGLLRGALRGAVFLCALVLSASMMPVETLPAATWEVALALGFVSSVFDNIPLTALALKQGGYDWGFLAYAVGFGGSMVWFGSSAGVAMSNMFPEARSVGLWLRHGWPIAVAYVVGFFVMLAMIGFHPGSTPRTAPSPHVAAHTAAMPG